jgi:hypothetical protein
MVLRSVWLLTAISVMALILPAHGQMQPPRPTAEHCCARMPAHHGHCSGKPAQSRERQCCASCAFGVSLINLAPLAYVFSRSPGETLIVASVEDTARFIRPPVPPPRA